MTDKSTPEQMQRREVTHPVFQQRAAGNPMLRGDDAVRAAAVRMLQRIATSMARADETRFARNGVRDESEGTDHKRTALYS